MPVPHSTDGPRTRELAHPANAPPRNVVEAFDRSVALVLGVDEYQHGVPRLTTAARDASAVASLLAAQHGFTTLVLLDDDVTSGRVRAHLQDGFQHHLGDAITERDRLLIYFAGHGVALPHEGGPEGYLLLSDSVPAEPRSFLAMAELRALVGALPCRHVLIILDCCFAGTFRWAGARRERPAIMPAFRETLARFVSHRAWQVLVSASHDQTAADELAAPAGPLPPEALRTLAATRDERHRHSPFAAALLRGLRGAADLTGDNLIVATELELFVRDEVERTTDVRQTPQLYKLDEHDRGEFVFQVPGTTLALEPAPALSPAICPFPGPGPYELGDAPRLFGRGRVVEQLVARVVAQPCTVVAAPSGAGSSSLLAAGLGAKLRGLDGWSVIVTRLGMAPCEALRDLVPVIAPASGSTIAARVAAWLNAHPTMRLCIIIDHAHELAERASARQRHRMLAQLAEALGLPGNRLHVVLGVRSELPATLRTPALAPYCMAPAFVVQRPTQDELREIIEQPARSLELSYEPAALVDLLINETVGAPGGLSLLPAALRALYDRCAERNRDRLLTLEDYATLGQLPGLVAHRADAVVSALVAEDPAYARTMRRVLLRMVVWQNGDWQGARVHRDDLAFGDRLEDERARTLLARLVAARLVVTDHDAWEPAHDALVTRWPTFVAWRDALGRAEIGLLHEVAEASRRWYGRRRPGDLWHDHERLKLARAAAKAPDPWLTARDLAFITASTRRRRARRRLAISSLVAVAVGLFVMWDGLYRVHHEYYRDFVRRWGAPEGLEVLDDAAVRARTTSVRLVRNGRWSRVARVELVGRDTQFARTNRVGAGYTPELGLRRPAKGERMPCEWDFEYDAAGDVISETARDRNGRIVYRLQYRSGSRERRNAGFLDEHGFNVRLPRGDAELVEFVRSSAGLDVEKRYFTRMGSPGHSEQGVSIERIDYNDRGHVDRRRYFDTEGKPTHVKDGSAGVHNEFDRDGNRISFVNVDEDDHPVRIVDGFARVRWKLDRYGNQIEAAMFDPDGKPACNRDGYAGWRATYDERGNQTSLVLLDERGQPVHGKDGYTMWRAGHDEHNRQTWADYYGDEVGTRTLHKNGYAGIRFQYDEHGNQIETHYVDMVGNLVMSRDGYAGWTSTFDARGNQIGSRVFDDHRRPTRQRGGYAGHDSRFDEHDNEYLIMYVDEQGKPVPNKDGFAGTFSKFDERGNERLVTYLDTNSRPTASEEGCVSIQSEFDPQGDEVSKTCLDARGAAIRSSPGYATYRSEYDAWGNETGARFLDERGLPSPNKDGVVGSRWTFDRWGNEIEVRYVDANGNPSASADGYAATRSTFDAAGNELTVAYLDAGGSPVLSTDGYAGTRSSFDVWGHELEAVFLDAGGKPFKGHDDYAGRRSQFDRWGNESEHTYLGEDERPIRHAEGYAGWRSTFDARGNERSRQLLDEHGAPVLHKFGYASWRATYDARGNQREHLLFDLADRPVRTSELHAGWRSTFDAYDRELTRTHLDPSGRPTRISNAYTTWRIRFDEHGRAMREDFLDSEGRLTRHKDGYASWVATFDVQGNEQTRAFLDEHGHPALHKDGYTRWRVVRDAAGKELRRVYEDRDGNPVRVPAEPDGSKR